MRKTAIALASGLLLAVAPSFAATAIDVVSTTPVSFLENTGATYTPLNGNLIASYSVGTRYGHVRVKSQVTGNLSYEIQLVSVATAQNDLVVGLWDVWRNGVLVCNGCVGRMFGLVPSSPSVTISIGDAYSATEKWRYVGNISYRNEF